MLLRTRVVIFASFALIAAVAAVIAIGQARDAIRGAREEKLRLEMYRAVWSQILMESGQAVEGRAAAWLSDPSIVAALDRRDVGALSLALSEPVSQAGKVGEGVRLDLMSTDGNIIYSSASAVVPTPLIERSQLQDVVTGKQRLRGIARMDQTLVSIVAFPIITGGKIHGAAVLASGLTIPVQRLSARLGVEVYVVDRVGQMIVGLNRARWTSLQTKIPLEEDRVVEVEADGRQLSVASTVITGLGGGRIGSLILIEDYTEAATTRMLRRYAFVIGTALIIVIALVLLHQYMRRAFRPLDVAIGALNALSQGDTRVYEELKAGDDEIGRVAGAVDLFRVKSLELERLANQRERRRHRQARFIRRQMESLAATLDDEARQAILDDLVRIQGAAATVDSVNDDLGLIAVTFERLADRISSQQKRLTQLVKELQEALATKTQFVALQQELSIARNIQLSALPKVFPDRHEVDLSARMIPAKEVGGDFYDFFWVGEDKLGIAVADVSGKGIPAAFFMMISRTLLRATCQAERGPGRSMEMVNNLLVDDNEQMMFVTCFYGELDLRSGRFVFVNCGHNPPLLVGHDGNVRPLGTGGGMALAVFPDVPYEEQEVTLHPGDAIVLFTDGVTEAFDRNGELFGNDRLVRLMAQERIKSAAQGVDRVMTAVNEFADGAAQSDDITCMVLRYRGPVGAAGISGSSGDTAVAEMIGR